MYVCRPLNYTDFVIITTSSDLDYRQLEEKKRWVFFFWLFGNYGKTQCVCLQSYDQWSFQKTG